MVTGVGWHRSVYNLLNHLTLMTGHAGGKDSSSLEKLQALMKYQQLHSPLLPGEAVLRSTNATTNDQKDYGHILEKFVSHCLM